MGLERDIARLGGIVRTRDLVALGHDPHALSAAVGSGRVLRIRKGYYALPDIPATAAAAQRVGGTLAGLSALSARGVWIPARPHPLAVSVPPNAHRLRSPRDARRALGAAEVELHWDAQDVSLLPPHAEPVGTALRRIAPRVAAAELFAAFESALIQGLLSPQEEISLRSEFIRISPRFEHAGRASGGGGESLLKFDLVDEPYELRQQVRIEDAGWVDFVLGRRQVVEVDGERFHSGPEEFERDRRRYAMASIHGFRTLRFSARMVEHERATVLAAIRAAVARGDLY